MNRSAYDRFTGDEPELEVQIGDEVRVLAVRHDFGISDLNGTVSEIGEHFVAVAITRDELSQGLGISAIDVSADRLEVVE